MIIVVTDILSRLCKDCDTTIEPSTNHTVSHSIHGMASFHMPVHNEIAGVPDLDTLRMEGR